MRSDMAFQEVAISEFQLISDRQSDQLVFRDVLRKVSRYDQSTTKYLASSTEGERSIMPALKDVVEGKRAAIES